MKQPNLIPTKETNNFEQYVAEELERKPELKDKLDQARKDLEECDVCNGPHKVGKKIDVDKFVKRAEELKEIYEKEHSDRCHGCLYDNKDEPIRKCTCPPDQIMGTMPIVLTNKQCPIHGVGQPKQECACFWYEKGGVKHLFQCQKCGDHKIIFNCECHCHVPFGRLPEPCGKECVIKCSHCTPQLPKDTRCKPCKLENNTGICDREDCSNHVPSQQSGEDWWLDEVIEFEMSEELRELFIGHVEGKSGAEIIMKRYRGLIRKLLTSDRTSLIAKVEGLKRDKYSHFTRDMTQTDWAFLDVLAILKEES